MRPPCTWAPNGSRATVRTPPAPDDCTVALRSIRCARNHTTFPSGSRPSTRSSIRPTDRRRSDAPRGRTKDRSGSPSGTDSDRSTTPRRRETRRRTPRIRSRSSTRPSRCSDSGSGTSRVPICPCAIHRTCGSRCRRSGGPRRPGSPRPNGYRWRIPRTHRARRRFPSGIPRSSR